MFVALADARESLIADPAFVLGSSGVVERRTVSRPVFVATADGREPLIADLAFVLGSSGVVER